MTKRITQKRDKFGRFVKRGPPKKAPAPPRGPNGRYLSKEQIAAASRENFQRLADRALTPAHVRRKQDAFELRRKEVEEEKRSRYQRFRQQPNLYKQTTKSEAQTVSDSSSIRAGYVPAPTQVLNHGIFAEYIWTWYGPTALQTATDFLLLAREVLPPDAKGALAMGDGRGKNSTWIGTRFGSPTEVFRHSQTFTQSQSGNTVQLLQLPHGLREPSIWAEVKFTTTGRVDYVGQVGANEISRRARKPSKKRKGR